MRDFVSGAILIVFAAGLLLNSKTIENPGYDLLGPAFLPQFALWVILLLAVGLVLQSLISRSKPALDDDSSENRLEKAPQFTKSALFRSVGAVVLLAAFVMAVSESIARFEILASVYIFLSGLLLLPVSRSNQTVFLIGLISIVTALVIGYTFKNLLHVNLP